MPNTTDKKAEEKKAPTTEVTDGKVSGADAAASAKVHDENMERFAKNAAGNEPATTDQVVKTAVGIDKGQDPEIAAMENDPDEGKGPSDLAKARKLTEEAESSISTLNQNRQAHPVVKPEAPGGNFNQNVGAVLEATTGTAKLQSILDDIGEDTPDHHVLFGRNGIAFTVGDLRGSGLKRRPKGR